MTGMTSDDKECSRREVLSRGAMAAAGTAALGTGLIAATGGPAEAQPAAAPRSDKPDEAALGTEAAKSSEVMTLVMQSSWRYCQKCNGAFFGLISNGVCPAGGQHDPSASGD